MATIEQKMKSTFKRLHDQSGMTLIELMVSMAVFLVVSAGVASTLAAGLQTTLQTRVGTMGKAEAQEQMEEMRSRVFYVPYSTNPSVGTTADVDLLDKYFPDLVTQHVTDSDGWQGWYTYSGNDAYFTKVRPADSRGIVTTVITRFIDDNGNAVIPQSYDSNSGTNDTPPSDLVSITVITSWSDNRGDKQFELNTIISSTGQTVQGAGDAEGEQGCNSTSNNYIDIFGGTFDFSTGIAEPYTPFIDGGFSESHAKISTGCDTQVTGSGTGGRITINGATSTGSDISAAAPPSADRSTGPADFSNGVWPQWSITGSKANGEAEAEGQNQLEGEGESSIGGMTVSLQEIDGWPGGDLTLLQRWDFLNPAVKWTGGMDGGDPVHGDDQSEAEINQESSEMHSSGKVFYDQIEILPLEAKTLLTPSAAHGLIIVKNFKIAVEGKVDGQSGQSPAFSFEGDVYLFNNNSLPTCQLISCYAGPYHFRGNYSSGQSSATTIQSLVNLNDSRFRLIKALNTELTSPTKQQISNAVSYSHDGKTLMIDLQAMLKISMKYGQEIRMMTVSPFSATLMSQQGLAKVYMGSLTMALSQG